MRCEVGCLGLVSSNTDLLNWFTLVHVFVDCDPALISGDDEESLSIFQVLSCVDLVHGFLEMSHVVRHCFVRGLATAIRIKHVMSVLMEVIVVL